jgi:hypothetical protein
VSFEEFATALAVNEVATVDQIASALPSLVLHDQKQGSAADASTNYLRFLFANLARMP